MPQFKAIYTLDGSNDIFFKGLNGMIGINKFTPTATVDISSNIVEGILNVEKLLP